MTDTGEGADAGEETESASGGRSSDPTQLVAGATGTVLVGSYALAWVDVVGPARPEAGGTISAAELAVLPELTTVIGVLAAGLSLWRWTRRTQLAVLGLGLSGTGLTLFVWFFLRSDADLIRVGSRGGPPSSFEPAAGLLVGMAASLVLVGVGFVAALGTLDRPDTG